MELWCLRKKLSNLFLIVCTKGVVKLLQFYVFKVWNLQSHWTPSPSKENHKNDHKWVQFETLQFNKNPITHLFPNNFIPNLICSPWASKHIKFWMNIESWATIKMIINAKQNLSSYFNSLNPYLVIGAQSVTNNFILVWNLSSISCVCYTLPKIEYCIGKEFHKIK